MKSKFEKDDRTSMLGATIQGVRKSKGLTQQELGNRVGLPKSSISKIESGLTHISFEDASLLLDAMGEKLDVRLLGGDASLTEKVERGRFVTICTIWYAQSKSMTYPEAYRYLLLYKGIQFLEDNYKYEQTLPRTTILYDMDKVCHRQEAKFKEAV
jgi:transcriptional regulator with XRE-family HTH domain